MRGTESVTKRRTQNSKVRCDSRQHLKCVTPNCIRPQLAKGLCEPCYRAARWAAKTPAEKRAEVRRANGLPDPTRPEPAHCECCGCRGQTNLDHDHLAHEFRGWICTNCN